MTVAAERALTLTGADGACVELLDGEDVVNIAAAGAAVEFLGLRLKADRVDHRRMLPHAGDHGVLRQRDRLARPPRGVPACRRPLADPRAPARRRRHAGCAARSGRPRPATSWAYESQLLALLANIVGGALVRAELIEKLTGQAVTDELTGLANRRAWYHQLDRALARGRRTGQPLSILILDLDGFKRVNDEQGHSAGDALLKAVGDRWTAELRAIDLLGRTGGDEFGVILELTDGTAALEVIARLERAIIGLHRASIGLAVWDGAEDVTALIARADADMYARKRANAAAA